ncbi:MAG: TMEM175 family protein [Candidatus Dormibacteraeota bacterium]|nr:TMEM175 family protein [Candidatus Dormibacteraeota bacterium]
MSTTYNRFAGQSLDRLAALSDGLFAIAMTLLVLDLRVPASALIRSEGALWNALVGLSPHLIPYLMSFLTLGIFWVAQQTQLSQFKRSNRDLAWIHLGFLLSVSLIPFSTGLLAAFLTFRIALIVYWANILLLGFWLYVGWRYAARAGLLRDEAIGEVSRATERRILIAQALYALGALLCVINTYVSIAFIVLVQLNFVIAPRFLRLHRL